MRESAITVPPSTTSGVRGRWRIQLGIFRNPQLSVGTALVGSLVMAGVLGPLLVGSSGLVLGAASFSEAPSGKHWLGTDTFGRDILTFTLHAIMPSLTIGVIAGGVGTTIGAMLGLLTGYLRGPVDSIARTAADVALTIPSLAVLIVLAAYVRTTSVELMALVIAAFSWPFALRAIRAQTLALREQAFVRLAKLSGRGELGVVVFELLPNLIPYIAALFAAAVNAGILAAVGLQLLGLGPQTTPTLGLMLDETFRAGALIRGLWWWWVPPTALLVVLFVGLFLIALGLDTIANPRLRRAGTGTS